MADVLKVYSVVIAWCDGDSEQGDWGTYVRAADYVEAEKLARLAMRAFYITNEVNGDEDVLARCEPYDKPNGFGGRVVTMEEGPIWAARDMEKAIRAVSARVMGEFDSPYLAELGPLGSLDNDVLRILAPVVADIDSVDGADTIYASAAEAAGWEQGGDANRWWHTSHGSWKNAESWGRTYATAREVIESADYPEYQGKEDER